MQYEEILQLTADEIFLKVKSSDEDEVTYAVLSAIYHYDTPFAADLLLRCLRSSKGMLRLRLAGLVSSYMDIHRTNYLVDSVIAELGKRDASVPSFDAAYEEYIEDAKELSQIYRNRGN